MMQKQHWDMVLPATPSRVTSIAPEVEHEKPLDSWYFTMYDLYQFLTYICVAK